MTTTPDTSPARTTDTLARPSRPSEQPRTHEPLDPARLRRAKAAYTTRFLADHLRVEQHLSLVSGAGVQPRSGDIVLARVVEIGQHQRLESPASRRASLFLGDEVLVAYGHRYAPDQFEAEVPDDLGAAHLVAAGGVIGRVTARHASIEEATLLQPIGLLADDEGVLTLDRFAPHRVSEAAGRGPRPTVVAVLGTSMNSGKSTTLACPVRGPVASGLRVSARQGHRHRRRRGSGDVPRRRGVAGARLHGLRVPVDVPPRAHAGARPPHLDGRRPHRA
ncbi:hypothetical protein [Nocardioides sp. B-3]|uniref:hypothetical protein n=1 Tax=Nocardioides sp. B-3 TaxID=2895565 RepID=UPI0021536176|nr:hypothetical protein [Nocardioides sp. B-3]UUZ60173.1 hypothetical protein LP418_04305 [Nocardioides sp. B-3]